MKSDHPDLKAPDFSTQIGRCRLRCYSFWRQLQEDGLVVIPTHHRFHQLENRLVEFVESLEGKIGS